MSHPFFNFGWIFSIPFQPTARTNFNKQFKFGSWCSFDKAVVLLFVLGSCRLEMVDTCKYIIYIYLYTNCHSRTLGLENLQNTAKRQSTLQKNYWPCSSFGHVFQQSCALKSYHVTRTERFHGLLQVGWKHLPVKVVVLFRGGGFFFGLKLQMDHCISLQQSDDFRCYQVFIFSNKF